MIKDPILSAKEFAAFARTTRHKLVNYEEEGLLLPISRDKNDYRQYSRAQLCTVNLIRTFQALGMSLNEIKPYVVQRSPADVVKLLERRIRIVDEKVENWKQARKLLSTLIQTIRSVHNVNESAIVFEHLPGQAITIGEPNDYSGDRDYYDALHSFYAHFMDKRSDMDMNHSVWGMCSEEQIKRRDWKLPNCYYFNDPDGKDTRPAGFYVIGYKRGGYTQTEDLYERLMEFIDDNKLKICGPAYVEHPLNELCIPDANNYLVRIMITVTR